MWILSYYLVITISSFVVVWGYAPIKQPSSPSLYNELPQFPPFGQDGSYFLDGGDLDSRSNLPFSSGKGPSDDLDSILPYRIPKQMELMEGGGDYDFGLGLSGQPSIRDQEYLQHSSLWGHKYISGGGGETQNIIHDQKQTPTDSNTKTDAVLPAYCNPPNPCPVGFTAEDGCLELFENTAAFSRAYQSSQECMCDTEHMFDCSNNNESDLADDSEFELSQQDFLNELRGTDDEHRTVAKKFYNKKDHDKKLTQTKQLAQLAAFEAKQFDGVKADKNPFLHGDKLPIAAKKGNRAL